MTIRQQQLLEDMKAKQDWALNHPYEVWVMRMTLDGINEEVFDSRFSSKELAEDTAKRRGGWIK